MESDELVRTIGRQAGIELVRFESVGDGLDSTAQTFRAWDNQGAAYFVKTKPSIDPAIGWVITLNEFGIKEVLTPLRLLHSETDDLTILLYPWIDGENGFRRMPPEDVWRRLGEILRRIHDYYPSELFMPVLATETFVVPGVDEFQHWRMPSNEPDEIESALLEVIDHHKEEIDQVIQETFDLGNLARGLNPEFVFCHTDLHMGNVLVDKHDNLHIIDWDTPRLAPRECDLMFFVDGGILKGHGSEEEAAFFEGYGLYERNHTLISYYQHERRLGDIVSFAQEALAKTRSLKDRNEALQWFTRQLS